MFIPTFQFFYYFKGECIVKFRHFSQGGNFEALKKEGGGGGMQNFEGDFTSLPNTISKNFRKGESYPGPAPEIFI